MKLKKLCSYMLIFYISLLTTQAQIFANIPNHTDNFYVNDFANVLTNETSRHIYNRNLSLEEKSGAQIVVTTVHFTDGMDIEEYAIQMFNEWGIGDAQLNNGLLLLLVIGEDTYFAGIGDGMDSIISEGDIDTILYTYLEPVIAEGNNQNNYDEGVLNAFNAIYDIVDSFYPPNTESSLSIAPISYVNNNQPTNSSGSSAMFYIFLLIVFIMIIPAIFGSRRIPRGGLVRSSMLWWLMSSSLRKNTRQNNKTIPPVFRYKGNGNRFGGGGGFSSGGIKRGGSRLGGGGRSSGGGVGRRK